VAARLARATLGNPRLVAAVEAALGEPVEVVQFGALRTKPGDAGAAAHFDYKPYRVLGSSLRWLVVVIVRCATPARAAALLTVLTAREPRPV
jgi:hypothetical protein